MLKTNKKGHVLFIVHDVYQNDNHFPLGIGYMAAILRRNGIAVTIYSQDIFHYTNEELAKFLQRNEFDLIGIGFMGARFKETVLDLCKIVNKFKKNAWLVLGGNGPTPISKYILQKTHADVVALGEAEDTILEVFEAKRNHGDLSNIKGIAFRSDDDVIINVRREPIEDLDLIPFPEWSLFPMEKYATCLNLYRKEKNDRILGILTSRGCSNRCNFCYRMEKGIRFRSIDDVIEEIRYLKTYYGINYFFMCDEMFVSSKSRIFKFRDALEEKEIKIKFSCAARVDILDKELGECLKECGCQFLNFGMESANQKILNRMKKHTTVEDNIRAAKITKELGIGIGLNFIFGSIGDTEQTLNESVRMIKKFNSYDQLRTIRPVIPYPGTDLYYEAIEKHLLAGPDDFFRKFTNSDLLTVNFTNIPNNRFYKILFDANKELIIDHYKHTSNNMDCANAMITDFYNLYFGDYFTFRGARHY